MIWLACAGFVMRPTALVVAADPFRERHLIARRDRHLRVRHGAARRAVDEIHAARFQPTRQLHRLLEIPAALDPVSARDAHEDRQGGGPCLANGVHDLEAQPDSIVE
jgi:hypothetical protein